MDETTKKRFNLGIADILLAIIIILCIIEFAGLLSVDLDYTKKIISWVCVGYLLYSLNITEVIFGYSDKLIDLGLTIGYFMLVMKDFILFSRIAVERAAEAGSFLLPLYTFILDHAFSFETITFYIGGGIIILMALLNLFLNTDIRKPSIMAIFFSEGPADTAVKRISRAIVSFILYCAFFVMVFNLVMEWLGWAVDSTIAVVAIFFYLLFFIRHYRRLDAESFLYRVGDVGEDFYSNFISLFRSKDTLMLGITGLLVLHLLTDTGNFIIPYIMGKGISYFVTLGPGHTVITKLMTIDLQLASTLALKISVVAIYLFNIAAMLFLFIGPAFVWYEMYLKRRIEMPCMAYGLFFASLFVFLFSPVFRLSRISVEGLYGVDILTNTITMSNSIFVMGTAVAVFSILCILSYSNIFKEIMRYSSILCIVAFFSYYVYLFFADVASFYAKSFVLVKNPFIISYFIVFMLITMFFYLGGIFYFVYATILDIKKRFI